MFSGFALVSFCSSEFRCYLNLLLPSLCTGRGRSLLLTMAFGLLLDGPVRSISNNLDQVSNFATCMYEEMKLMACRFTSGYDGIFGQFYKILKDINEERKRMLQEISQEIENLRGEALRRAQEKQRKLKDQIEKAQDLMNKAASIINVPSKIASGFVSFFTFGQVDVDLNIIDPKLNIDIPGIEVYCPYLSSV